MFTYNLIINNDRISDFGYTLLVDADYPKYLQPLN